METFLHCHRCLWLQLRRHNFCSRRLLSTGRKCYYEALGLKQNASPTDIKAAFLELSKKYHPDVNTEDPKGHEKFVNINEAYTVLSRPSSKLEYDEDLKSRRRHERAARHTVYEYDPERRQYNTRFHSSYRDDRGPLNEDQQFWQNYVRRMNSQGGTYQETPDEKRKKLASMRLILGFAFIANILYFCLASLSWKWNQDYARENTYRLSQLLKNAEERGKDPNYHSEFKRRAKEIAEKEQARIQALKERRNGTLNRTDKVETEELAL